MTPMDTTTARFDVRSADGTTIAVWVGGDGPALVMVHGSLQDHTVSAALVGELNAGLTTYAVDRRGFGASGDHEVYSLEREFEDIASVVDEVAARSGGPVALWGHSYGANCAMGAANLTDHLGHLLLYEPSLGLRYPSGWIATYEATVAVGDVEGAIVLMFRDLLEFNDQQIDAMRASPEWPGRIAVAHTLAREARAEEGWDYRPGQFDRIITPTLLIAGSDSTEAIRLATDAAAASIAGARIHLLAGHAHVAHRTHPALIAKIVRDFIAG
jgi:pimeloyl-ACP methyl ester carboxylesterase